MLSSHDTTTTPRGPVSGQTLAYVSHVQTSRWHVFQVQPQCEQKAEQNLENMGFKVFLPRIDLVFVRDMERKSGKALPSWPMLFPGYGFVKFHAIKDAWQGIRRSPGVRRLFLSPDQFPIPVPVRQMRNLIQRCVMSRIGEHKRPTLKPGTTVQITSGVMRGERFVISNLPSQSRVSVLMQMLGHEREVDFDIDDVVPVS